MNYANLTLEAKEVVGLMVEYCVIRGIRMGMAEGHLPNGKKEPFRVELENFCGLTNSK